MQAYTEIIQSLHNMNWYAIRTIEIEVEGAQMSPEYEKRWREKSMQAWEDLRRQIDIGEFLLSPASIVILKDFMKASSEHEEDWISHLVAVNDAAETCLPKLKQAAREDLGLPKNQ